MKRVILMLSTVALMSMVSCGTSAEGSKDGSSATKVENCESGKQKGGRKANKTESCCSEKKTTDCSAKSESCCSEKKSTDCSAKSENECQSGACSETEKK